MLADRQLRHPVPVAGAGALRLPSRKRDVDRAFVELNLPLDVLAPPFDEIVWAHDSIISDFGIQISGREL